MATISRISTEVNNYPSTGSGITCGAVIWRYKPWEDRA